MQIQVRTSINVRSNTVPSTPAFVQDALPENWSGHTIIEKPAPEMPTLVPRLDAVPVRLKASQRPRQHSRLSSYLHGFSVVGGDDSIQTPSRPRKMYHYSTQCYARTPRTVRTQRDANTTGLRPANSTRGVIDPVHSPNSATWPLTPHIQDERDRDRRRLTMDAHQSRALTEPGYSQQRMKHRRTRTIVSRKEDGKSLLSHKRDPKVRKKIIGCLVFGTLLAIVLTTCTSHLPPYRPPYHILTLNRPRPRDLQFPPRRHFPRRFHLLHHSAHHIIQPLPNPALHARLQAPTTFRKAKRQDAMAYRRRSCWICAATNANPCDFCER